MAWNSKIFKNKIERSISIIENKEQLILHEATARKHAKRYLISKHGNICSICNQSKWLDKDIPLVCDHINGNSSDNRIENFRLVCCNCDALLPTYKSKNKNGRAYDRQYMNKRNTKFSKV